MSRLGVLAPFLRIHVPEVENLRNVPHLLDVARDGRAVHEDKVKAIARDDLADASRKLVGVEEAE